MEPHGSRTTVVSGGEILGDPKDVKVRERLKIASENRNKVPNLYKVREELLFADYLDQAEGGCIVCKKSFRAGSR